MINNLQLVASRDFNGVTLNCYQDTTQQDSSDFWATREQIGLMLGYADPRVSIANIHQRNKERLDKFSRVIKMITHEETRSVTRDVTVYNFKGLLEICRFSNQPIADKVMDVLWDIADEIRRTGRYSIKGELAPVPYGVMEGARMVFECAGISANQLALAMDKVYRSYTGRSALNTGEVTLEAPVKQQLLTPTEIAKHLGFDKPRKGARIVNKLLADAGYQRRVAGTFWEPTEVGASFAVMLDTNKRHSDGTPVRSLKWNSDILAVVEALLA